MKETQIVKPVSIGQENITRDEIATVYASQKINGLKARKATLLPLKADAFEKALTELKEATIKRLSEDSRYTAVIDMLALMGEDLEIRYNYNIRTYDDVVWTIADNMVVQRTFNEKSKFSINVILHRHKVDNGIILFKTNEDVYFHNIGEELHEITKELNSIESDLQIDWKTKYLETLIASILNTNLMAIGNVTLPEIKLLDS